MRLEVRLLRVAAWILVVIPVLLHPRDIAAQTITDPRTVEFLPSAQHSRLTPEGVAIVSSYSLSIYLSGRSTASQVVDLGKPSPASDGLIRIDFLSRLATPLSPGVSYQARVSANGPGGSASSDFSNPFTFAEPCTYGIGSTAQSVAASGGTGSLAVVAGSGCAWTVTTTVAWLTVTSPASRSGTGAGSIVFSVAPNSGSAARTGEIRVGGRTLTVTQAASTTCTFTVTPGTTTVAAAGGSATVTVTASASTCQWSASSARAWITVPTGTRTGSGTLACTVASNGGNQRSATVTVAGRPVTVTQGASTVPSPPTNLRIVR
jgi:hypothetical protein